MTIQIHPTAIVDPKAQLGEDVFIGPFCTIGPHVSLGAKSYLHSHVVITGNTTLGEENEIFPFASIGHNPQDLKFSGEETFLEIGSRNKIRECVTLQPGTDHGGKKTCIQDSNLFMAYSHIAHDCRIGSQNVFANNAAIAGHVVVGNHVVVGGLSGVHQFCEIGDHAMVAAGSICVKDVPPFCIAEGPRAHLRGLNVVGMRRRGFTSESMMATKKAYKILFLMGFPTIEEAVACLEQENLFSYESVKELALFVQKSKRGVIRPQSLRVLDDRQVE